MSDAKPLKKPVDWDDLYPGRFLKAGQLGDKRPTVTIKEVAVDRLLDDNGQERIKGVLRFAEMPYELALNKTNGICLRALFGRQLQAWVGRRVTLYRGEWKGEPAVRVWGSPELTEDLTVEVKLPRRKPLHMTLHAVRKSDAAGKPDVAPHPTEGQREGGP